jgi:hypothetical protein
MSLVVSITETEVVNELIYNLYGYNSRLFRKLNDEQTRFEGKILDDLSKISYRLLHSNPFRSQRNTPIDNNNDNLLADCILPKVFVSTIESNHFQLLSSSSSFSSSFTVNPSVLQPVLTTSPLLSSVLKYFYRLSTNLAIIRIWCRSSSLSSALDPSCSETFENQPLGGDSYDLSTVKNSVNKILLSIEQELSLTELQIRGQSSYFETQLSSFFLSKLSATTGAVSSSSSCSSTKITLLRFYQQCMKYERLLPSLLGMILNFHDNYDLYATAATTTASSASPSSSSAAIIDVTRTSSVEEERAKKQHRLSLIKLQQSFNQISFLYQSEIILKKGEKLEHYNSINHHLSPVPSASRSSTSDASSTMIFYRKHRNSDSSSSSSSLSSLSYLSSLNYFYLFIKQLSVSYVEYLTRQIMQSLWNKGGKGNSVLSVNVPLISRNGDSSSVNNLLRMMNSQGIPG